MNTTNPPIGENCAGHQATATACRKVAQVSSQGDITTAALVLSHARAPLIALTQYAGDTEVELRNLTVGTSTAALILELHPEYVRYLIRSGRLQANKENGEFRIELPGVVEFMMTGMQALRSRTGPSLRFLELWEAVERDPVLWQRPDDVVKSEG